MKKGFGSFRLVALECFAFSCHIEEFTCAIVRDKNTYGTYKENVNCKRGCPRLKNSERRIRDDAFRATRLSHIAFNRGRSKIAVASVVSTWFPFVQAQSAKRTWAVRVGDEFPRVPPAGSTNAYNYVALRRVAEKAGGLARQTTMARKNSLCAEREQCHACVVAATRRVFVSDAAMQSRNYHSRLIGSLR